MGSKMTKAEMAEKIENQGTVIANMKGQLVNANLQLTGMENRVKALTEKLKALDDLSRSEMDKAQKTIGDQSEEILSLLDEIKLMKAALLATAAAAAF